MDARVKFNLRGQAADVLPRLLQSAGSEPATANAATPCASSAMAPAWLSATRIMRVLPRLRRSPLAAAVRDRISQRKGSASRPLTHAHRGKADARPSPSRATARCVRPAPWARAWARFAARARRAAAESDGCQPKSRDAGATRRRTAHQPACPREARTGREVALPLAASVCMFLSVRLRGRRLRTRWLGALGLCSRHLRRRRLHGTRAGAATCPLAARRRAALGAWSRRRKQLHEHGFGIRRHGRRNRRRRHAAPDQASDAHMQGAGQQGRDSRRCAPAARIPAIPAQAVDMAGGKHRDHLQYSTDKPDSTGDRG